MRPRDLPSPPPWEAERDTTALREAYALATAPLLRRRLEFSVALFLAFVALALWVDLFVHRERLGAAVEVYVLEAAVCILALVAARIRRFEAYTIGVAASLGGSLAILMNVYFARVELMPEIQALGLVCLMTSFSALVPLGCAGQTIVTIAALGGFFVASETMASVEQAAYCWVGLVAGATTSIWGSYFLDRYRYEAFARAALLEEVSMASQEEARICEALAHVGATLHANSGQPHVFETVNRLARETLGCDWSRTYVLDETAGGYRIASSSGARPEVVAELASYEIPTGSLAIFQHFRRGELVEIPDAHDQALIPPAVMARYDVASALFVPIWRREQMVGVIVNGYESRTGPFTPTQRRIALGIGDATAIALENLRLVSDLKAASHLKSEFVSTMSHELRTPLHVISGYVEMLVDPETGGLSSEQLDLVRRVNRNASSLLELIDATLHLGRLETGRDTLELEWIDLGSLFAQLAEETEALADANDVIVGWRRSGLATDAIRTDRVKLKMILKNLIGNALKFTRNGEVLVSASGAEETLVVEVRDSGIGIAPEDLATIFEMFRQVDRSAPGVGLGLHIVQRLTERLKGTVQVESEPGRGTCFTVSIPVQFLSLSAEPTPDGRWQ